MIGKCDQQTNKPARTRCKSNEPHLEGERTIREKRGKKYIVPLYRKKKSFI